MKYCKGLAKAGGDLAASILGTEVMNNEEGTLRDCALANVRLPLVYGEKPGELKYSTDIAKFISDQSVKAGTFFAVVFYRGSQWWRISAQCYLELSDIEWGARTMKKLCEQIQNGEYSAGRGTINSG